ncbi:MAG: trigger factor [Firmicutes bacterium]|nr:trigger factor [Bacillota bacterium]
MVKWEKIDGNKIKMEIEVSGSEVDGALERAYFKVVKDINLPGFRKGKVPRRILEARFGPEVLYKEAVEILLPGSYRRAIDDENIEPIDEPEIDIKQIEKGKPFVFTAIVEVKPEVKLGDYKGVEVEVEEDRIDEAAIDERMEALRNDHASLVDVEDDKSRVGESDLVMIDFCGYMDGKPFEGGEAKDYSLEIGSHSFIPGFEEQLIGSLVGDEKELKVTFPDDYRNEELAGKEATFKVTVKNIKRKELPALDDDFICEISEFDNVASFREDLTARMKEEQKKANRAQLESIIIEKITAASEVEAPEVLIEKQLNNMISDIDYYLQFQGMNLDRFLEVSRKTLDDIKEENREEAINRVKANLVLDAIIKAEGIVISEEELEEKVKEVAEQYHSTPEKVRDVFEKQGRIKYLQEEARMRKLIDFLVENARVETIKKKDDEEPGVDGEQSREDSGPTEEIDGRPETEHEQSGEEGEQPEVDGGQSRVE